RPGYDRAPYVAAAGTLAGFGDNRLPVSPNSALSATFSTSEERLSPSSAPARRGALFLFATL
ncbi:MAG TPA: hypothetical protein VF855_01725, partial [Acidimicrobiales bacterium]